LAKVFEYNTAKISGEQMDKAGVIASPDYYVRRNKHVFLFESKDVIFNAEIKESTSFDAYETEIKKKLYYDDSSGKVKPKAVLQLIRNVKRILSDKEAFEKCKHPAGRIYPIIVVHSRQLNVGGLNHLVKAWFRDELMKLANEGLNIKKVAQLTIINIATLIHYSDFFATKRYPLSKLIEEYHRTTSMKAKPVVKSYLELENILLSRATPFNLFVAKKIQLRRLPSLIMQHAKSIFPKHQN
jgi:hypothetical protein